MQIDAPFWIAQQRSWIEARGAELDADGRVGDWRENLATPVSRDTRGELARSPRGVLGEGEKPGELQWPHATDALVLNALEPFRDDPKQVARALGAPCGEDLEFAKPLAAPGAGDPPELPLWLEGPRPTAVVARFVEPYEAPNRREVLDARTLESSALWTGLAGTRSLAGDHRFHPERFARLDLAPLLRSVLALQQTHGSRGFRLVHLWNDAGGRAAAEYRGELDRLRIRIGGEVDFVSLPFEHLFDTLPYPPGYGEALRDRYLPKRGQGS